MNPLPYLHLMTRVDKDIEECLEFISNQPRGNAEERESDIWAGIGRSWDRPKANRVACHRLDTGIDLRRCSAAQFVIVYAYLPPTNRFPNGIVSIRAVRHSRVADVFAGVREPSVPYGICPT